MRTQHHWTKEDLELLREMYQTMTVLRISQRLRVSFHQVANTLKRNKITKNKKWTKADLEQVKELYQTRSIGQVAIKIGVGPDRLRGVMHYHGITKHHEKIPV